MDIRLINYIFAVCAVASRYNRPDIYPMAMELAGTAAGNAHTGPLKSITVIQAYLLLAVYPVPKRKWTEDTTLLLGAIASRYAPTFLRTINTNILDRMAIELGLDQPAPPDCEEREALNRTRTWLNCFCVDRLHASQFGKPSMIRDEYLARNSQDWYTISALSSPFDIHLCALVDALLIYAGFDTAANNTVRASKPMPYIGLTYLFLSG